MVTEARDGRGKWESEGCKSHTCILVIPDRWIGIDFEQQQALCWLFERKRRG
jgi:hypothetical protein